jgi:oligopeptide/dipeptide ABC transporter ATP-binding protein
LLTEQLLKVEGVCAEARSSNGVAQLLREVSLSLSPGEIYGLVGETGAGKSLTAWAIMGLLEPPIRLTGGTVSLCGLDLTGSPGGVLRAIRGRDISYVVQNARDSLDPMVRVGSQLIAVVRAHNSVTKREARMRAIVMLRLVGIADPERVAASFPPELSGGMAQRVVIGMAMINEPQVLIADEPTTGLDLTIQAQILDLIAERSKALQCAVLLITHDIGVVAQYCARVGVMFAGRIIEEGDVQDVLGRPRHPYSVTLIRRARKRLEGDAAADDLAMPPDPFEVPPGCHYAYRCARAKVACSAALPRPIFEEGHWALCRYPETTWG